jgi:hypothetical protein
MKVYFLILAIALAPGLVQADVVDNPGRISMTFDSTVSFIRIGDLSTSVGDETLLAADVDSLGNIIISREDSTFPDGLVSVDLIGDITVRLELLDGAGSINPLTGQAAAEITVNTRLIHPAFSPDCHIGPVTLTTSAAVPYSMETGQATLNGSGFPIPAAQGCGLLTGVINAFLHLPTTDSGAQFAVTITPIIVGS